MRGYSTNFALQSRPFRVFAAGNLASQTGEWMTWVALNWAVLDATGSALYLAAINACRLVPAFVFSVPAGVLADLTDRRKLLVALFAGVTVSTLGVGFLLAAGSGFWLLATVVALRSSLMAAVVPVRNALLPNLVSEEKVASAVAVDAATRNLARILGPAAAGALLVVAEAPFVFWVSAASVAAQFGALLVIRPISKELSISGNERASVREAILFVRESPSVQSLLILSVAPLLFAFPYTAMMPLFANDLLRLGPGGLGIVLAVAAVGALAGSTWLSLADGTKAVGKRLVTSTFALGIFLVAFMFTQTILAAMVAIFLVGLSSSVYRTTSRAALQTRVPDRLRGRILSIALMDRGFMPLGAIMIGAVAELTNALWAGVFMGGGCVAVTLAVLATRRRTWSL